MAYQNPTPEHQNLVLAMINHLHNSLRHKIIQAAYEGFTAPVAHGRHEPDIMTEDQFGLLHIVEAKVGSDLNSENTKEQFSDFANRIMNNTSRLPGSPVPFHIIVYKADEMALRKVLSDLNLQVLIGNGITIWTL